MNKIGRNAPCPCGSGLKYKRCCEAKDLVAAIRSEAVEPELEFGEMFLCEAVYGGILTGVWLAFHQEGTLPPGIEEMEDFYHDIYGHGIDPLLIEEIALPLSPLARARLPKAPPDDDVVDV